MEEYVRWFVEQEGFYRLMLVTIVLFGATIGVTGAVTANIVLLGLGVFWVIGGGALVVVLANRDPENT
ncbi:hypothetical protein OB905_13460 [Halobacteria archaeon AArc-dxtr1]|nr:hypothetical protein [Halobacteria archaeon AArc-dxtr1]